MSEDLYGDGSIDEPAGSASEDEETLPTGIDDVGSATPRPRRFAGSDPFPAIALCFGIAGLLFFCLPWVGISLSVIAIIVGIFTIFRFGRGSIGPGGKTMAVIAVILGFAGAATGTVLLILGKIVWRVFTKH